MTTPPAPDPALPGKASAQLTPTQLECWKTTIQTNQHFNTLQLQLRNFSITVFLAILTAVGFALKEHIFISLGPWETPLATFICGAGLLVMMAFYYMDWGYHQLLKGAVAHAGKIEEMHGPGIPEISLSNTISASSKGKKFLKCISTDSTKRLTIYYGFLMLALAIVGGLAVLAKGPAPANEQMAAHVTPPVVSQNQPQPASPAAIVTDTPECSVIALKAYYESGKYLRDVTQATDLGWIRIENLLKASLAGEKLAVVFDIDETCLSTWPIMNQGIFCWDAGRFKRFIEEGKAPPIEPVRDLLMHLVHQKVAVFMLSSRNEDQRAATIQNLEAAGFTGYTELILKGPNAGPTYKADLRKHVRDGGYRIIANVGDQLGDLDASDPVNILIPNPFYTTK